MSLLRPSGACVAVCCGVLQCVAVCCSVLQYVAVRCSVLQCVTECYIFVAPVWRLCCGVLRCVAVCCSALQCVAVCDRVLYLCGARLAPVLQCLMSLLRPSDVCVALCRGVLHYVECIVVCCRVLQCVIALLCPFGACVAACCSVLCLCRARLAPVFHYLAVFMC